MHTMLASCSPKQIKTGSKSRAARRTPKLLYLKKPTNTSQIRLKTGFPLALDRKAGSAPNSLLSSEMTSSACWSFLLHWVTLFQVSFESNSRCYRNKWVVVSSTSSFITAHLHNQLNSIPAFSHSVCWLQGIQTKPWYSHESSCKCRLLDPKPSWDNF